MPTTIAGRSTRMEVLELLRRKGGASAETISSDLGVTPNAVRQHLTNLEREGFVVSHPERRRRGRPSLLFSLTERADSVFPKRYGQLASMVLQEVQDMGGPAALDDVFERMARRRATVIAPTLEGLKVTIHNCPFRNTALKFPQVCTITPHLFSQLLGTGVSQADSIHRRDPYCSFVVQRPPHPQ